MSFITDFLENVDTSTFINENIYLKNISSNQISKDKFINSQRNFINCVNYWSQTLGLLISQLDDFKDRRIILENLIDEHFGEDNQNKISHVETFRQLIEKLGGSIPDTFDEYTNNFNKELMNASQKNTPLFIAVLGFIEFYYQSISSLFSKYIKTNFGDINIHFKEHEQIDKKHCMDLLNLLNKYNDPTIRNALEEGNKIAKKIFDDYYTLIYYKYCFGQVYLSNISFNNSNILFK
jgi:hypothetical protein